MERKEQLTESLKDIDRITYYLLSNYNKKNCFGRREAIQLGLIEDRLYSLFLKSIDEESSKRLKELDKAIEKVTTLIENGNNWIVSRSCAIMEDNFQNQHDPEFATHDTYLISRGMNGYYVSDKNKDFNGYFKRIYEYSLRFLKSHLEEFKQLDALYKEKELIMSGNYSLRDTNTYEELPTLISEYLGYIKREPVLGYKPSTSM